MTRIENNLIATSVRYLESETAKKSIDTDVYWPKWDSPWWHMALLYEMGLADRIPKSALRSITEQLKTQFLPVFFQKDVPPGRDPVLDVPCPCQLGNIYQILSAAGVDMDEVLPWARSWFIRYQMQDGGLSCDEKAYQAPPQASSIVGTIAPLEAILFFTNRPFTSAEENFLDHGAACLINRKLMLGCHAPHNAEERADEEDWLKPCFPRFYFYDVLRGLNFILRWAEKRERHIPMDAIRAVVEHLERTSPDGQIRIERRAYEGVGTRVRTAAGEWQRSAESSLFPLLNEVSKIGDGSPYLSAQWREARQLIRIDQQTKAPTNS